MGRVGSGQEVFRYHGGRAPVTLIRSDPRKEIIRTVKSPVFFLAFFSGCSLPKQIFDVSFFVSYVFFYIPRLWERFIGFFSSAFLKKRQFRG